MKKIAFSSLVAVCLLTLTSCLGEGNNVSSGSMYGVLDRDGYIHYDPLGQQYPFYVNRISDNPSISTPTIFFGYTVDPSSDENVGYDQKGYLLASSSGYNEVNHGTFQMSLYPDTASILPTEQEVSWVNTILIRDYFFVEMEVLGMRTGQVNDYTLSWDSAADPVSYEGLRVYDLFLRVEKRTQGEAPIVPGTVRAFNLASFRSLAIEKEAAAGREVFSMRLNYPAEFSEDSTKIEKWGSSQIYSLPIPKR
jgi:hypothetical protein